MQRHAGAREGFRARLIRFLPVYACLTALLQISVALREGLACVGILTADRAAVR